MGEPVQRQLWGALYDAGLPAQEARVEADRLDRELALAALPLESDASLSAADLTRFLVARTKAVLDAHVERCRAFYDEAAKKRVVLAYERGVVIEIRHARAREAEERSGITVVDPGLPSAEAP
jgi:hypothetical protein